MNFSKGLVLVAMVLTLGVGCGHAKVKPVGDTAASNEQTPGKGITGSVNWTKTKKDAIDIEMTLTNKYDFPVRFPNSGFNITVAGKTGVLHFTKFSGTLLPGAVETALVSFYVKGMNPVVGPAVLTLDQVYSEKTKSTISPLTMTFTVTEI